MCMTPAIFFSESAVHSISGGVESGGGEILVWNFQWKF